MIALGACHPQTAEETIGRPGEAAAAISADACGAAAPLLPKAACADANVAAVNHAMNRALAGAGAGLSRDGRQTLLGEQMQWLAALRVTCLLDDAAETLRGDQSLCLQMSMIDRIVGLASTVQTAGPYTIQRVESFRALPPPRTSADRIALLSVAAYPRIDAADEHAAAFNAAARRALRADLGDDTEQTIVYRIAAAGPALISIEYDTLYATRGAAHPDRGVETLNFLMAADRPLRADDLFAPAAPWRRILTAIADESARALPADDECGGALAGEGMKDATLRPDHWLLTPDALTIVYPPYALERYAIAGCQIVVPWSQLSSVLKPDAPLPPSAPPRLAAQAAG
jgi:hypothetical protein